MTRILLATSILAAGAGCVHLQPVGPLARTMGLPTNPPPIGSAAAADDTPTPEPVVKSAPKPAPPAVYVTPAEVTPGNATEAAKRLAQEIETDRRALAAMPSLSEVSVIPGKGK